MEQDKTTKTEMDDVLKWHFMSWKMRGSLSEFLKSADFLKQFIKHQTGLIMGNSRCEQDFIEVKMHTNGFSSAADVFSRNVFRIKQNTIQVK